MWCIIKYFLRFKKIGPENREKEDTQYNETKPLYAPDKLYKIDISFETNNVLIIYYFDILNILLSNICRKWTCKKLPIFAKYENIKFLLKYMNRISCQSHIKLLPTLLLLRIYNFGTSYIIYYPNFISGMCLFLPLVCLTFGRRFFIQKISYK